MEGITSKEKSKEKEKNQTKMRTSLQRPDAFEALASTMHKAKAHLHPWTPKGIQQFSVLTVNSIFYQLQSEC